MIIAKSKIDRSGGILKVVNLKLMMFLFMIISQCVFAGTTGKIQGRIYDASTGQPLPGVNVVVAGTSYGAASDFNGEYVILRVPPGTYSVKATMIGYQEVTTVNVVVKTDLTTELDFRLGELTIAIDGEVIVTAETPIVQKDITASIQNLGVDQLDKLPVRSAKEGVMVQAGVFFDPVPVVGGLGSAGRGEARYSVRGGSQDEVVWYLDGCRTANLLLGRADWGGSFTNINKYIVSEAQVMTGGFTAEYGNAQSGIVNVVTREGTNEFHGAVEYIYGFSGQHHFGNYLYDPATQKEFLDNTLPDGTLDPEWWTEERQRQIYDYTKIPDQTLYLSFSGPLFNINGEGVNFFTAAQLNEKAYNLPHPRDSRDFQNFFFNVSTNQKSIKLKLTGFYNHDAHTTLQENGDFTNQAKYSRGWGSLLDTYTYSGALSFTHVLSERFFYDLKLSTYWVNFNEKPSEFNLIGQSENPTLWGFQRYDGFEGEPFDKYTPTIYNDIVTGDISLTGQVNWQFDSNNLFKTGFEFRYNTYDEKENLRLPSFTNDKSLWINRGMMDNYNPVQLAFYVQDKMEFESMILNIGLRYDVFIPNLDWFDTSNLYNLALNPNYDSALDPDNDQEDENGNIKYSYQNVMDKARSSADSYHMLSPRFGVSFPITENTVLHFNYGHYFQLPPLDQMYELSFFRPIYIVEDMIEEQALAAAEGRDPANIPSNDGDPERVVGLTNEPLEPQKTIQFEAGIKHNFEGFGVLEVTAYYKDVFDQTAERVGLFDHFVYGWDPIRNSITPNISYQSFLSGDYGDSRGFEINFRTLFSETINLSLNYSFSKSSEGRATPRVIRIGEDGEQSYEWDVDVNKRIPIEKSYSRPHIFRANLFLQYPKDHDESFLSTIMEGTSMSVLYKFISGQAFTYLLPTDAPDTYNNYRFTPIHTVDLQIEKSLEFIKGHELAFYIQVTNLFNTQNLRSYGDAMFDSDATKNYVENGTVSSIDAAGYDIGWQNYFEKRRLYMGVKYSF